MTDYRNIPDKELIQKYCRGDGQALSELVNRYKIPLFTFIRRSVFNRESSEDIFQETFLKVIKALPQYSEDGKFKSWLFTIANNLCINHLNSLKLRNKHFSDVKRPAEEDGVDLTAEHPDTEPLPDKILENAEAHKHIESAIQYLNNEQREVFLLRTTAELSFSEISDKLNRPLNTVLSQMRTAILKIKKQLNDYYE